MCPSVTYRVAWTLPTSKENILKVTWQYKSVGHLHLLIFAGSRWRFRNQSLRMSLRQARRPAPSLHPSSLNPTSEESKERKCWTTLQPDLHFRLLQSCSEGTGAGTGASQDWSGRSGRVQNSRCPAWNPCLNSSVSRHWMHIFLHVQHFSWREEIFQNRQLVFFAKPSEQHTLCWCARI